MRMITRPKHDRYADNPRYLRSIPRDQMNRQVRVHRPIDGNGNEFGRYVEKFYPDRGDQGDSSKRDRRVDDSKLRFIYVVER